MKTRTVTFTIVYMDDTDDEESIRQRTIDVSFTGKISPGMCMQVMANSLREELERDEGRKSLGEKLLNPLIDGRYRDMLVST